MKKIAILLALLIIVSLSGCNSEINDPATDGSGTEDRVINEVSFDLSGASQILIVYGDTGVQRYIEDAVVVQAVVDHLSRLELSNGVPHEVSGFLYWLNVQNADGKMLAGFTINNPSSLVTHNVKYECDSTFLYELCAELFADQTS